MVKKYKSLTVPEVGLRISKIVIIVLGLTIIMLVGMTQLGWFNKLVPTLENQAQMESLARIPMTFIENQGQWESPVEFMVRRQGIVAYLQKEALTLQLESKKAKNQFKGIVVNMAFEGTSNAVTLEGDDQQSGIYNFFVGRDPSKWCSKVPGYSRVIYHNLYEGMDLRVRDESGSLEYDVLLDMGADLNQVVIRCDGVKELNINPDGSMAMETGLGSIIQKPPQAWYVMPSGEQQFVECRFRKLDVKRYGFEVPDRDLSLAMVIDPGLEWSTFLGGTSFDRVICLGLDASDNVIVSGETESISFPTTPGAYDTTFNEGGSDIHISCLTADGSQLLWSTFLGGSGRDEPYDLAMDYLDQVTVVGVTFSSDFPTTAGALDTILNGINDAVVARLNPDGTQLVYSTYLGGSAEDWVCTIEVDGSGEAIVGGYTGSSDFQTTPGVYDTTHNGLRDAFVTRLNADGSDIIYSTFLGGSDNEGWEYDNVYFVTREMALTLDSFDEVVVVGMTESSDFPITSNAYDTTFNGVFDVFVTRLNATFSNIIYSTFLGGGDYDYAYSKDAALNVSGVITLAGATYSADFPTTPGAFDRTHNGDADAFVARLDATASNLLYSTYIGGLLEDGVMSMTMDNEEKVIIVGFCRQGFPTTPGAYDTTWNGYEDVFISHMSLDGNGTSDLLYSTYLGTSNHDWASSVVLVGDSTLVVAGQAKPGFPTTPGAYDTTYNGGLTDGFICRFGCFTGIFISVFDYEWIDFDGDEHADPGDTLNLTVSLRNSGKSASTVDVTLSSNDPYISILDSTSSYGEILKDSVKDNSGDPFIFWVDDAATLHKCTLNVDIVANSQNFSYPISFVIGGIPPVLVIDDDGGDKYENYFTQSLDRKGYLCDVREGEDNVPASFMSDFQAVIWLTGDKLHPVDSLNVITLTDYLNSGGNLFITGQDVEGCADTIFYHNYLHATLVADSTFAQLVAGVAGDTIGDGFFFPIIGGAGAKNQVTPSIISPIGGADSIFNHLLGGCCGVKYEDTYKVVYLSFGFEAIAYNSHADNVMKRILNWFGVSAGVEDEKPEEKIFFISRPYPNPFMERTQIEYNLPKIGNVNIAVYNVIGAKVKSLLDKIQNAGKYIVTWDGRDESGNKLPSGFYFLRLEAGEFEGTRKLLLIK